MNNNIHHPLFLQWFLDYKSNSFSIEYFNSSVMMFETVELTTILRVVPSLQAKFEEHVILCLPCNCSYGMEIR